MYFHDNALEFFHVTRFGEVEVAVRCMQNHGVAFPGTEIIKEFIRYSHSLTNYAGGEAPSDK